MRLRRFGLALATLLVIGGCGGAPGRPGGVAPGSYLEQGRWDLRSIDELRIAATAETQPWFRLVPAEGRVEGSTGCNSFSGPYRAGGSQVGFGPLVVTLKACTDPTVSDIERRMLDLLETVDEYVIDDGVLQFRVRGSIRMIFAPAG